jgi:hypothetical protein
LENPAVYGTLQAIVLAEQSIKKKTATEGLLWLKRGLEFTVAALSRNVHDPNEELSVSFSKAYEGTLSKFHNFIARGIFSVMVVRSH